MGRDAVIIEPKLFEDARQRPENRRVIQGPLGLMAECFCINCGKSGGLVTDDWSDSVFYLCDKCAEKWGPIANDMQQVADAQVRGELNARSQNPQLFDQWQKILEEGKRQVRERRSMGIKLFVVERVGVEMRDIEACGTSGGGGGIAFPAFRIPGCFNELRAGELPIGACWYGLDGAFRIVIPSVKDISVKTIFCPLEEKGTGTGWTVEGDLPKITVTPSIWCNPKGSPPGWHGWIRDGYLIEA